ncbi:hypothetical protein KCL46_003028 [Clostridium perfringens]|nr:hypothetical protein [Clostridium perfringens]
MSKKKEDKNNKIIKIVYFDESTAVDYIQMKHGGIYKTQEQTKQKTNGEGHIKFSEELQAKVNLLGYLKGFLKQSADADIGISKEKLLVTTIGNTILTDFLKEVSNDNGIKKFNNKTVYVEENSFTYIKLFSPYMAIAKDIDDEFDVAKVDEALKNGKGYYEMLIDDSNSTKILRFNINAFKNNYGLIDLTKMNLTYFGVLVGKCCFDELKIENQFSVEKKSKKFNAEEIINGMPNINNDEEKLECEVYDVILAGVEYEY